MSRWYVTSPDYEAVNDRIDDYTIYVTAWDAVWVDIPEYGSLSKQRRAAVVAGVAAMKADPFCGYHSEIGEDQSPFAGIVAKAESEIHHEDMVAEAEGYADGTHYVWLHEFQGCGGVIHD